MRVRAQVRDAQRAIAALDVNYRQAANRLVRAIGEFSGCAVLRAPSLLRKSAAAAAVRAADAPKFLRETRPPDASLAARQPTDRPSWLCMILRRGR
jgi:hypothetical protein